MARLRLKELATERGLNMNQVSRQTGLTLGMVRRYWRNETSEVSLEALDALAALLKVEPGELFAGDEGNNDASSDAIRAPESLAVACAF